MTNDRYGGDVLAGDCRAPERGRAVEQPVELGMVVEDAEFSSRRCWAGSRS